MSNLKKFPINKACKDETLANSLYWHVTLEKENEDNKEMQPKY